MKKSLVITQSSYIPWRGYFDLINFADEFVIYDDVQFTKRDWRTRNSIKSKDELFWLSIPVKTKGRYCQKIEETETVDNAWVKKHWNSIRHNYSKAPFFDAYTNEFKRAYEECLGITKISEINHKFLLLICNILNIKTKISFSKDYGASDLRKTDRLIAICQASQASEYISGPSAKAYLDEEKFLQAGISLSYIDYTSYPEYPQLNKTFLPEVSILDLIFNTGPRAKNFMRSFENQTVE